MRHNIRIARELVRIAKELLSKNEEQAIADAVAVINDALAGDGRTASIENSRLSNIIIGTLLALALAFGYNSALKAIDQSDIEDREKSLVEATIRNAIESSVRDSEWFKESGDEGVVHNEVQFSRKKVISADSEKFYCVVGRLNKNGGTDLCVFEGSMDNNTVIYPPIGVKTLSTGIRSDRPDENALREADNIILDKLLN